MSQDYANPQVLVETDWLADRLERLEEEGIRVVEVSEEESYYAQGHIPGAVTLSWKHELRHPIIRDFVPPEEFAKLLEARGISNDTTVILYGDNNNWFASYAFWLFKLYGHEDVRLLNGGRKKWEAESRPLTQEIPQYPPANYRPPVKSHDEIRAYRDQILSRLEAQDFGLVDVRSHEEFIGERLTPPHLPNEGSQVGGHIPGAKNIGWGLNVREDGTFKSAAELEALYQSQGITRDKEIVTYCRIGERASVAWFALSQLLGYPHVRNYDGSWTEWGSSVGVPISKEA